MRTPGSAAELEARRRRAAALLGDGKSLSEVARLVGAHVSSVKRWKRAIRGGGPEALAAKPHPGRTPWLTIDEKHALAELLCEGAQAAGFANDLWTCRRVAQVIRERFGVTYHRDHVGRLLRGLGFTPQKPQRRASQRDEDAIEQWRREDWPRIKKGDADAKLASCFSMKQAFNSNR